MSSFLYRTEFFRPGRQRHLRLFDALILKRFFYFVYDAVHKPEMSIATTEHKWNKSNKLAFAANAFSAGFVGTVLLALLPGYDVRTRYFNYIVPPLFSVLPTIRYDGRHPRVKNFQESVMHEIETPVKDAIIGSIVAYKQQHPEDEDLLEPYQHISFSVSIEPTKKHW